MCLYLFHKSVYGTYAPPPSREHRVVHATSLRVRPAICTTGPICMVVGHLHAEHLDGATAVQVSRLLATAAQQARGVCASSEQQLSIAFASSLRVVLRKIQGSQQSRSHHVSNFEKLGHKRRHLWHEVKTPTNSSYRCMFSAVPLPPLQLTPTYVQHHVKAGAACLPLFCISAENTKCFDLGFCLLNIFLFNNDLVA